MSLFATPGCSSLPKICSAVVSRSGGTRRYFGATNAPSRSALFNSLALRISVRVADHALNESAVLPRLPCVLWNSASPSASTAFVVKIPAMALLRVNQAACANAAGARCTDRVSSRSMASRVIPR